MACNFSQMTCFFIFLSLLLVVCFGFSKAQKVPAMYVFGDSLVDVGNNNYLKISLAKADFPHNGIDFLGKKPTGRFSNGKNSADFLAEKVGLVASPPPYLSLVSKSNKSNAFPITGVSFASGGAGIFNGTDELFKQAIPLTKQVEHYATVYDNLVQKLGSASAQDHLSKSLFTVVIGSNDMFGFFQSGSDVAKKTTAQQYVDSMVLTLKVVLQRLHDFGARKYVITGIGAVGCCPSQRNQNKDECNEEANKWSVKYNDALKTMLQGLKLDLKGMDYSYVDVYNVFARFIETPSTFGFTEVKSACCGLGNLKAQVPCVPVSTYCSNRSNHIFWDLYHPTETAARIFVDTVFYGTQQFAVPKNVNQLITA
ncbi:GDSL esterase/lipase [Actinidia chinensis var. chinensis]|uniref:GDSL esterase/lipase n=1 Tax=Actinidia chinensis var. chinensis TaxID=1590841 RepID=A0A2R6QDB3_ACTCC|nr:GDSL esterase/lipase [Actinidia chinensis var. chinensis]